MTKDIDPGALFDEARKLERDGRTEEALQRYHYVATNWPNSIEGGAARLECERLADREPADTPPPSPVDDPSGDEPGGEGSDYRPQLPVDGPAPDLAAPPPPFPESSRGGDGSTTSPALHVDFDPDYSTGIATARFAEFCGWILVVIMPFFAVISITGGAFDGNAGTGLVVVFGMVCVGLIIIVMAQASRALLETANTNREILAVIKAMTRAQVSRS